MEPDYSSYTRQELIEAYESIDRDLYPERFEKIRFHLDLEEHEEATSMSSLGYLIRERVEGRFQNQIALGTFMSILFFFISLWGTYHLIENEVEDFRALSSPVMLIVAPWMAWYVRARWKKHRDDFIRLERCGVTYRELKKVYTFSWSEVEVVSFFRVRYLTKCEVTSKTGESISFFLFHFGLDSHEVKTFVHEKAIQFGFKVD